MQNGINKIRKKKGVYLYGDIMKLTFSKYKEAVEVAAEFYDFLKRNKVLKDFLSLSAFNNVKSYVINRAEIDPAFYRNELILAAFDWKIAKDSKVWTRLHLEWRHKPLTKEYESIW